MEDNTTNTVWVVSMKHEAFAIDDMYPQSDDAIMVTKTKDRAIKYAASIAISFKNYKSDMTDEDITNLLLNGEDITFIVDEDDSDQFYDKITIHINEALLDDAD